MKQHIFTLAALLLVPLASSLAASAEDSVVLRRVADGVLKQPTRRLIDRSTGQTFEDGTGFSPKPEISIESKFNAWSYQMWLLADWHAPHRAGAR